jgi:hypothetical protein
MNQNDISKRHQNDINDISKKDLVLNGLFGNGSDETLYACAQKFGKIAAAVHLVADVMDDWSALAASLQEQSLGLVRKSYGLVGKSQLKGDQVMNLVTSVDEVVALVEIGSIARAVSRMNADIILGELGKTREVLVDLVQTLKKTEQSFVLSQYAVNQPVIQSEILEDVTFESKLREYNSKRHQNDIKTTLIAQNDILNDTDKNKTTSVNDIPRFGRQKDILNIIKSGHMVTLAIIRTKVPDVSEKTLQRELATLIEMGLIRKEGNKRWTTYRSV